MVVIQHKTNIQQSTFNKITLLSITHHSLHLACRRPSIWPRLFFLFHVSSVSRQNESCWLVTRLFIFIKVQTDSSFHRTDTMSSCWCHMSGRANVSRHANAVWSSIAKRIFATKTCEPYDDARRRISAISANLSVGEAIFKEKGNDIGYEIGGQKTDVKGSQPKKKATYAEIAKRHLRQDTVVTRVLTSRK
jgi:hypothetical protein